MAGFDPDKFLAKVEPVRADKKGFDPDAFLSKHGKQSGKPEVIDVPGAAQTALESFGNTVTLGYLPHIQAALEKPMSHALDAITGNEVADDLESYVERRDQNINRMADQEAAHPVASGVGKVAGAVNSAVTSTALAPIKGAGMLARAGNAALQGGVIAGAANPGDAEGVVEREGQFKDRLKNAALGMAIGAGAQGAGDVVAKGISTIKRAPELLRESAEESAFKGTGAFVREFKKAEGQNRVREIGRIMLDKGLIKPGASYEDILTAARKLQATEGPEIGRLLEQMGLDEALAGAKAIDRTSISDALEKSLIQDVRVPGVDKENAVFRELIDQFRAGGQGPIGIKEAADLKQATKGVIKWDRLPEADIPVNERFHRTLYSELRKGIEDQGKKIAKQSGLDEYIAAKKSYGAAKDIENAARKRVSHEKAKNMFGILDRQAIGGGAMLGVADGLASGDPSEAGQKALLYGALGGLGSKALRSYGRPAFAVGADKSADLLEKVYAVMGANARNVTPELLKKYAPALRDAANRGGTAMAATVYMMTKDPEYKAYDGPSKESIFKNPKMMEMLRSQPALIDKFGNEGLRNALKREVTREAPDQKTPIAPDQARKKFTEGN